MKTEDTRTINAGEAGPVTEPNPHIQLIDTICNEILPNMVRLYESRKMYSALDRDQFETLIEQKVERANKSLKILPVEQQHMYRQKIDQAYAENIDRLHAIPEWKKSVYHRISHGRTLFR